MGIIDAVVLGLVEGLTELLPVSSTGHLILVGALLGHHGEAAKSLDVVIQLGAVLALLVYFRARLGELARGLWRREPAGLRLGAALACGFVPTALAGLALHRIVKAKLFGPLPVALALAVGGVLMIGVERWQRRSEQVPLRGLEHIGPARGLWIGLCQCLALWPGASRSMTTIVGGQLVRLETRTAAEFSFLLALPTLGAATLFDLAKSHAELLAAPSGATVLAVGTAVSFAVTLGVVALFLRYVGQIGMTPFGVYRIGLAAVVWLVAGR